MKKYLLTAFLGLFGLVGAFASADTLDGFTSSSEVCKFKSNSSFSSIAILDIYNDNESPCYGITTNDLVYVCVSTSDIPYYMKSYGYTDEGSNTHYVDSSNYCFAGTFNGSDDDNINFYSDSDGNNDKTINGTVYISSNSITYSSSVGGDSSGSLLPGGESDLSGIITGLNSTITEFIPYLVYLGLGIITVIIGFVAIRWLVNRTQAKIRGTFSSGRRRK